jgi:predicted cupin superfamily sugar epimerase
MKNEITMKIDNIIDELEMEKMPVEGCYFKKTFSSDYDYKDDHKIASHIYGLYAPEKDSQSCFHKLSCDESWHFYGGNPLTLYLIYPDGKYKEILLGSDLSKGETPFFVIPSGVWQAGKTSAGGSYSLFGCTVMPSFIDSCFYVENRDELLKKYPNLESVIKEFGYIE